MTAVRSFSLLKLVSSSKPSTCYTMSIQDIRDLDSLPVCPLLQRRGYVWIFQPSGMRLDPCPEVYMDMCHLRRNSGFTHRVGGASCLSFERTKDVDSGRPLSQLAWTLKKASLG